MESPVVGVLMLVLLSGQSVTGRVLEQVVEPRNYDYTKYHPLSEITAWMKQIETENPGVVSTSTYGTSYEKRDIAYLKIGLNSAENKKAIWMDCGIHSREWISPAFCQHFVKEILRTYKTDAKLEEMLKNLDFYVTPVLNVDGYAYTWKDNTTRLWRKNRSPNTGTCNCTGTDLNRNYNAVWGTVGVSSDCCSIVYPGTMANSELETQAVVNFVEPRSKNIIGFLTIHSYGQMILFPYGHLHIKVPNYDELTAVVNNAAKAIKAVHGMDYIAGSLAEALYPAGGTSMDWARLIGIPYSFTFELRDKGVHGFELPEDQIQQTCEETYEGARSIITYIHDKTFHNITLPNDAATLMATMWTVLVTLCLSSAPLL